MTGKKENHQKLFQWPQQDKKVDHKSPTRNYSGGTTIPSLAIVVEPLEWSCRSLVQ